MHLGIRIRHIPKKVGKNIVFQCHETIEAAEILCYKFIKGQIELSLFLGKQPFSLTKCECRGLNDILPGQFFYTFQLDFYGQGAIPFCGGHKLRETDLNLG